MWLAILAHVFLVAAIVCLVIEAKTPGISLPGFLSAGFFALFFVIQAQFGGELIYIAITLFCLGVLLLGLEVFVIPGFGATGIIGILLIVVGLVLAGVEKYPMTLDEWVDLSGRFLRYLCIMGAAVFLAFQISHHLPHIPVANRLLLIPAEEPTSPLPGVERAGELLGEVGYATTILHPGGKARFGERLVDVMSEGNFIEPGAAVRVIQVEGTNIVVRPVVESFKFQ